VTPARLRRILAGHKRTFLAAAIGLASYPLLPAAWPVRTHAIAAWDIGALTFLILFLILCGTAASDAMEPNAEAQQEGEWTLFFLVLAGASASFAAILGEFGSMKDAPAAVKEFKVALVAGTLLVSWLLTHAVFALRYAHEFYSRTAPSPTLDQGLEFPGEPVPDYWDFVYFSIVLGMTFQVSDVQITSRKLRRLATLHGLLSFLFNTVIVALTVNLASGLLG
jgi:uncharacterized membrane protein